MTVRSDRDYFREHPQYYMYQHPQMPSHDTILAARDRLLSAHPALRFDAVHLASLEWDVDRVAAFLDRFPNASVDLAARMVHLQHQAAANRDKVRAFLLRYQDRVLYGSDVAYGPGDSDAAAVGGAPAGRGLAISVTADVHRKSSLPLSAACVCPGRPSINSTGAMRRRCSRRAGIRLDRQPQRSQSQRPLPDSPSAPSLRQIPAVRRYGNAQARNGRQPERSAAVIRAALPALAYRAGRAPPRAGLVDDPPRRQTAVR